MDFNEYFQKYPMSDMSEKMVLQSIAKEIHCAKEAYKKDKKGMEHMKYMAKAWQKMEHYFRVKHFDPDNFIM